MPFTAQEVAYLANTILEHNIKGAAQRQTDQSRPMYDRFLANKEEFGGGNEYVTKPVKGMYTSGFQGYTHDDQVGFGNPANVKRVRAKWYELHAGLSLTFTELKEGGIHVQDSATGEGLNNASDQEIYVLTNIVEDKFQDLDEGSKRSLAEMMLRDGTQDAKAFPGLLSILTTTPTAGTTFGLDRAANSWWRHRTSLNIVTTTPSDLNITNTMQKEVRQLRRYAKGGAKHAFYAGSDFLDAWEKELRSKGNFTLEGWAKSGSLDASMADLAFKGVNVEYEPLLDDLSLAKTLLVVDHKAIKVWGMRGEQFKMHSPARPPNVYALYRSQTWTGMMLAQQLNTSGRYSIA